jgi:hypothetical protein
MSVCVFSYNFLRQRKSGGLLSNPNVRFDGIAEIEACLYGDEIQRSENIHSPMLNFHIETESLCTIDKPDS